MIGVWFNLINKKFYQIYPKFGHIYRNNGIK